jgi:F-type H+-transporting ATPase subunit b
MFVFLLAGIQLIPDGTLLIHIALILLMIWILNRTFFRPINKVLESRAKNTGGRSGEAQEILKQVQEKHTVFDSAMRETRSKGYEVIEESRSKAVEVRQSQINAVKEEVATMLATEKAEIATQTDKARKDIAKEAEKLAEKISSNILKA